MKVGTHWGARTTHVHAHIYTDPPPMLYYINACVCAHECTLKPNVHARTTKNYQKLRAESGVRSPLYGYGYGMLASVSWRGRMEFVGRF